VCATWLGGNLTYESSSGLLVLRTPRTLLPSADMCLDDDDDDDDDDDALAVASASSDSEGNVMIANEYTDAGACNSKLCISSRSQRLMSKRVDTDDADDDEPNEVMDDADDNEDNEATDEAFNRVEAGV
jgi:hypothetical protein